MRRVKDAGELEAMRRAGELTSIGMEAGVRAVKPGLREYEVAAQAEYAMRSSGSEGTAFETLLASGRRAALPHGVATGRVIEEGDLVVIDLGAVYEGYRADMTRTVVAGRPTARQSLVYDCVLRAHQAAFQRARAGTLCRAVDAAARRVLRSRRLERFFIHGTGHGVGLDVHEAPALTSESRETLSQGDVVTIEPAVYIQGFGGVRIEDTVHIRRGGAERLTFFEKSITPR